MFSSACKGNVASLFRRVLFSVSVSLVVTTTLSDEPVPSQALNTQPTQALTTLQWRVEDEHDVICEGFNEQPLVDALTRVSGDKLMLLEASNSICVQIIDVAGFASPNTHSHIA